MDKELIYQNKKIHYQITGSGKPVILIHGFGEEVTVWNNQAPSNSPQGGGLASAQSQLTQYSSLSEKFKFIIPDLPGSGQSEMIDDMSMEGMAEVIKIIIEKEASPNPSQGGALDSQHLKNPTGTQTTRMTSDSKVPPCGGFRGAVLIGHSMGGYITLALIEKYPELVSAFGLFHSSAFADSEEKKATRRKGIEFIQQHGAFEFLKTATPNLFSPMTKDKRPELIDKQINSLRNFSPAPLIAYYEAMIERPDRTAILRKTSVPVLFIMGEYDVAVPMEDGLKQSHLPEKSYIHILHRSGHMGMLEETGKSNAALDQFLQDI